MNEKLLISDEDFLNLITEHRGGVFEESNKFLCDKSLDKLFTKFAEDVSSTKNRKANKKNKS